MRIALALKGIGYREVSVDILGGAQFDPAYLAVNPQAVVPALETGDGGPPLFAGGRLTQGDKACDRSSMLGDRNLFAGSDVLKQLEEMRLRVVVGDPS